MSGIKLIAAEESERDPRIDPMPGDCLHKKGSTRWVKQGNLGLTFRSSGRYTTHWPLDLAAWRKWARGAEVLRRAEEAKIDRLHRAAPQEKPE